MSYFFIYPLDPMHVGDLKRPKGFQLPNLHQVFGHLVSFKRSKSKSSSEGKGSRGCRIPGCERYAKSKGLCVSHGGGTWCIVDGCKKHAKYRRRCISHGGRRCCSVVSCNKHARVAGKCTVHSQEKPVAESEGFSLRRNWIADQKI